MVIEPESRYCGDCDAILASGSRFCPECGASQRHADIVAGIHQRRRARDVVYEATPRDYTSPAIVTLILYFVLWLPGVIANLAYIESARNERARTDVVPEGVGCLWALLTVFVLIPLAVVVLACIGIVLTGK